MDCDIIKKKLESLNRCIQRIKTVCPASVDILEKDIDAQDILILNIQRAVQLCVDIGSHLLTDITETTPDSMKALFLVLADKKIITEECSYSLMKATGFRNIAVHEYDSLDMNIIFAICTNHVNDFKTFACHVITYINRNDSIPLPF